MAEASIQETVVETQVEAPKKRGRKPAAKRAAPVNARATKATKATSAKTARKPRKAAAKAATPALNREKLTATVKEVVFAQLGVYGRIYDEVNDRVTKARKDAPKQWNELVKRGERVQKDFSKARKDIPSEIRKDVEKRVADLKKVNVRGEVEARIEQLRKSVRGISKRKAA